MCCEVLPSFLWFQILPPSIVAVRQLEVLLWISQVASFLEHYRRWRAPTSFSDSCILFGYRNSSEGCAAVSIHECPTTRIKTLKNPTSSSIQHFTTFSYRPSNPVLNLLLFSQPSVGRRLGHKWCYFCNHTILTSLQHRTQDFNHMTRPLCNETIQTLLVVLCTSTSSCSHTPTHPPTPRPDFNPNSSFVLVHLLSLSAVTDVSCHFMESCCFKLLFLGFTNLYL